MKKFSKSKFLLGVRFSDLLISGIINFTEGQPGLAAYNLYKQGTEK